MLFTSISKWLLPSLVMVSFLVNAQQPNNSNKVVGAYFPSWSVASDGYFVEDIPADKLTHIIYAFLSVCGGDKPAAQLTASDKRLAEVCKGQPIGQAVLVNKSAALGTKLPNGSVYAGDFAEIAKLKKQHPHLVILPSFGGWTLSGPFHDVVKTDEAILRFVETAIALIQQYPIFDGIDVDWEFPGGNGETTKHDNPEHALTLAEQNREKWAYTFMMRAFRQALDKLSKTTGRRYELTSAINVMPEVTKWTNYKTVSQYMDYFFAMTYDYAGAWDNNSAHQANLLAGKGSTKGSDVFLRDLINAGVPAQKLVIGAAFYGRGWQGVPAQKGNPNLPKLGSATGPLTGVQMSYKAMKAKLINQQGYQLQFDQATQSSYLYNPENGGFISFDDQRAVEAKAKWAKENNLGGIFSWHIGHDNGDLVEAMNTIH